MFSINPGELGIIPHEIHSHINGYIPYKKCKICNKELVEFNKDSDDFFCSIVCLNNYNQIMLNRLNYNKAVIITHHFSSYCNYIYAITYISCMGIVTFVFPLTFMFLMIFGLFKVLFFVCFSTVQ